MPRLERVGVSSSAEALRVGALLTDAGGIASPWEGPALDEDTYLTFSSAFLPPPPHVCPTGTRQVQEITREISTLESRRLGQLEAASLIRICASETLRQAILQGGVSAAGLGHRTA